MKTPKTSGVHHVGLTVPNLSDAVHFFEDALGFTVVGQKPSYPAAFVSDGTVMITLWQAEAPEKAVAFDRRHVIGLHHIALQAAPDHTLEHLHESLSSRNDVAIEFAPEPLGDGPTRHLMIRIPGNIRVEIIAPS